MSLKVIGEAIIVLLCTALLATPTPRLARAAVASHSKPDSSVTRSDGLVADIPFERTGNLVFLPVSVNGSRPLWFILDSGANGCVIDRERAQSLGIPFGKTVSGTGAGKGTYPVEMLDSSLVLFQLPRLSFRASLVAAIDMTGNLPVLGRPVDGLIGYDLFEQYVVEIDYQDSILRLFDPGRFRYNGTGVTIPLVFSNRLPHIVVSLAPAGRGPVDRTLLIDSGSNDAADDSLLATARSGLIGTISGVGLGKEFRSVVGRWSEVRLGAIKLRDVPGGAGGVPLIGGEVLRRFRVTLDFARQRLILEPNSQVAEPFAFDASGMDLRLDATSSWLRVHDVANGSAADSAGVRVDDLIVSMDAVPPEEIGLDRVRALLELSGVDYCLGVLRDGDLINVCLRTRRRL